LSLLGVFAPTRAETLATDGSIARHNFWLSENTLRGDLFVGENQKY